MYDRQDLILELQDIWPEVLHRMKISQKQKNQTVKEAAAAIGVKWWTYKQWLAGRRPCPDNLYLVWVYIMGFGAAGSPPYRGP